MVTTGLKIYPIETTLATTGEKVTIRPLGQEDADRLLEFFRRVPEEERFFLKDDVTSPEVIDDWVSNMDYDLVLPLVAVVDDQIVADCTLHRHQMWARKDIGEIRIVVDPRYRSQGLGTTLTKALIDIAYDSGLDRVLFDLVEEKQEEAIWFAETMGFYREATLYDRIHDKDGFCYNTVIMELPLDEVPQGRRF